MRYSEERRSIASRWQAFSQVWRKKGNEKGCASPVRNKARRKGRMLGDDDDFSEVS